MKVYDGAKYVTLGSDFGWSSVSGGGDGYTTDQHFGHEGLAAYSRVPFVRRLVDLRSSAISGIPFVVEKSGKELELPNRDFPWLSSLRSLLWKIEASICVYGSSYLLVEKNRFGVRKQLRWISPLGVQPLFDEWDGLKGFQRIIGDSSRVYKPVEEIVYLWEENIGSDIGPGNSPVMTGILAAQVLNGVNIFADSYFKRGAIKATLLQVDGNPAQSELSKLEDWWRKLLAGVKNAWKSIAIRASVNPIIIGDGIQELGNMEMALQYQRELCAALGIPVSVISDEAANYATANLDTINMWTLTLIPETLQIQDTLNEQFFYPQDMELRFDIEGIEVLQEMQLQQAKSATELFTAGVLDQDEVRNIIGYGPLVDDIDELEVYRLLQKTARRGND
jgi:HK97 family phage portal protein